MKKFSLNRRSSGILLPLFSLPGPHGIGDLGPASRRFADFLADTGQSWWQMLPIGPTGGGDSPYQSLCSFKGNPLLLSLEDLVRDGWFASKEIRPRKKFPTESVDYEAVRRFKGPLLRKAFERSGAKGDFEAFVQDRFREQWKAFKTYVNGRGIGLIGDVPIFVSHESEDVRENPEIFHLDARGRMTLQAGVPPDYFSRKGQLWGCPHYRWDVLKKRGYDWWIERLRWVLERFDAVRLDHFIGFYRAWAVPGRAKTAVKGQWLKGPREDFFEKVFAALGPIELIAEDLGKLVPQVKALRDRFGLPGMRVLQFAFGGDPEANNYLPHNYPRRCVAYTGTHDNNTAKGWFESEASAKERRTAEKYLNSDGWDIHWDMLGSLFRSRADLVIVPLQDVLGLGAEARLNRPGTAEGNWKWRLNEKFMDAKTTRRLRLLTDETDRNHRRSPLRRLRKIPR